MKALKVRQRSSGPCGRGVAQGNIEQKIHSLASVRDCREVVARPAPHDDQREQSYSERQLYEA